MNRPCSGKSIPYEIYFCITVVKGSFNICRAYQTQIQCVIPTKLDEISPEAQKTSSNLLNAVLDMNFIQNEDIKKNVHGKLKETNNRLTLMFCLAYDFCL